MANELHIYIHDERAEAFQHRVEEMLAQIHATQHKQGATFMADLSGLQNAIATLAADEATASTRVDAALAKLQESNDALQQQVAELQAGQITQEQIDALTASAQGVDASLNTIAAGADPGTETPDA